MKRALLLMIAAVAVGAACAPTRPSTSAPAPRGDAANEDYVSAQAVLNAKCTSCHGADRADAGLRLDSWAGIMRGSDFGEAVIAFDPENSLAIEMATKLKGGPHPAELSGPTLTETEVADLRRWIADGARSEQGEIPFMNSTNLVYVCNQGEAIVSVIDADANVVIRNIDLKQLGFGPNAKPHHVAVEPGGEHWFVSLIGENRVLKFTRDNELVAAAEFEVPGMLVYDASRGLLYVGRSMSAVNPPHRIGVIDPKDMSTDEIDVFVPRPHALAVSREGDYVFTASLAQNTVVAVNADSYEATLSDLGGPVHTLVQFARAPNGTTLGAGGQLTGTLLRFDVGDPPAVTVTDSLALGGMPWHPVFGPDGMLFVPNKGLNRVSVVDLAGPELLATIEGTGLAQPHGSAASTDGRYIYVSGNNSRGDYVPRYDLGDNAKSGTVVVIDATTREIVKVLEVEDNATGVGAVPAR